MKVLHEIIIQLAKQRAEALVKVDAVAMRGLLADQFVYTNALGQVYDKDTYVKRYVESGNMRWNAQELDDIQVQTYGDTAVLTCRVFDDAVFDGEPLKSLFRATQVWVRQGEVWRCAAIQTTAIS